ncbi:hypothetical protein CQ022_11615 [Chryseobacterium culicis]|uniref:Uncharacterized protein n=1 Tax=Chryseobacterium culicis TaxID=680127 RepID=A0A2S9D268_CHRCI|nr:hypothetical protein CQ022_11615 [Chryseobacterium culicis]PRB92614.1 hypothetical protein CQ033_05285 [Chryseobacterium culicis]
MFNGVQAVPKGVQLLTQGALGIYRRGWRHFVKALEAVRKWLETLDKGSGGSYESVWRGFRKRLRVVYCPKSVTLVMYFIGAKSGALEEWGYQSVISFYFL